MAKNDFYQPQVQANGDMQQANNRGYRVNSALADAAPAISRGFDAVFSSTVKELDDQSRSWAANASSQADVAAMEMLEAKKRSAGDGAPKFKESVLEDWKKYEDETLKNAPNGRTSELMRDHFNAVREQLSNRASAFQNQETDRWTVKQAGDGVDADARLLSGLGAEEIDGSVDKSLGKWNAHIKALNMEPSDKQKLIDAAKDKVLEAANQRKIALDPKGYLAQNAMARNPEVLATDPNAPLGIRNNNPGNLRSSEFKGTVGVDSKGYGKFESPEAGLRAMAKNLLVQQEKHGLNTVEAIIDKYAPPSENNTAAYISTVAKAIGVGPADKLNLKDPATMQRLMTAMIKHENGVQPYSAEQIAGGAAAAIGGDTVPLPPAKTQGLNDGTRSPSGNNTFALGTWEQQQKWINLAETEVRRVEAVRKQKVTEVGAVLSGVKTRMESGLALPPDEMQAITAQVVETGDAATAKKWQDLKETQDLTQSMQQLSPVQLSNVIITQLEPAAHRDGATEREALQLDVGKKLLGTMTEKIKTDPISWAAQTGMQVSPLDFNKPETLPARIANAEAVSQKYGIPVERAIFSQAEKNQLAIAIDSMPNEMKLRLGKQMQVGFGDYFTKAVGEFSDKDPIFSHAAFLSGLSSANDGTALDIFVGQSILKEQPNLKPKDTEKQIPLADFGNAFELMPRAAAGIVAATDALYIKRVGMTESFDADAYSSAMQEVVGKTKDGTGGLGEFNGQKYLLPQQFTEDDFERGIQAMTADELAEMSIGGGHAIYGSKKSPATGAELYTNVVFKSVAYGQYAAFDRDGRKVTSDKGEKGQFILAINPAKFAEIVKRANDRAAETSMKEVESGYGADRAGGGFQ